MSQEAPFWDDYNLERDGIRIQAVIQPAINLALAHNDVPVVRSVRITNTSGSPLQDLTLALALDGRGMSLADAWTSTLPEPLAPGEQRLWDNFDSFVPAHDHLAGLNESHPATVTVTASHTWGPAVILARPVRMLAHNEWLYAPGFFESLAAFVQPNTRAVASVLGTAAELLRDHTSDAGLDGYQNGPERASRIAAAVYEALRSRNIRYVDPPAKFENNGQKVRTTAQVLEERLGTCIDLAVTYAACLEATGLHPLLWLIHGHAFAGYVRENGGLGQTVVTEPNAIINLVESGRVVPVEAAYCEQGRGGTFAAAVATGRRHFREPEALHAVIDVHAARRAGTLPLPSKDQTPEEEGAVEVIAKSSPHRIVRIPHP